ncbi:guanine-1-methyltransferase-domain-containing protein [Schizophyllum commune]
MSKSAMKKLAKAERIAAQKLERRAREKEMRKEKKRVLAQKRAAGELDENEEEKLRAPKRPRMSREKPFCQLVVDLGFDEKMSDNEVKSLASQLGYTYSANRRAPTPFKLLFTGLGGRTLERLESQNDASYKRWQGTEWWREGYEGLWEGGESGVQVAPEPTTNSTAAPRRTKGPRAPASQPRASAPQSSVVYLTADSEVELSELKEDETYIIGGICDHNRYKNLCLNKAKETGIRTARLPIGRYLAHMPTRKVLTVNQVVEIMCKWVETRDWEQALLAVMPKRKFNPNGRQQKGSGKSGVQEGGAQEGGAQEGGAQEGGAEAAGNTETDAGGAENKGEKDAIVVSEDAAMAVGEETTT